MEYTLLVGCTGFVGKCILYYILKFTKNHIFLVIRTKNNLSVDDRLQVILNNIKLNNDKNIKNRITLIKVEYLKENYMEILFLNKEDKTKIINNVTCVINGLADINFNRPIIKATQNNTLTAYNWLNIIKKCKQKVNYIYISTCYVNFHLDQNIINESIYEKNMNTETINKIIEQRITNIKPYKNTYCYTKQLAEIVLKENKDNINLHIIRPSIVCPAYEFPYKGFGEIQTVNLFYHGIYTGNLPFIYLNKDSVVNSIIPVDFIAKECLNKINDKNDFTIKHCSLNKKNLYTVDIVDTFYKTKIFQNKDNIINGEKIISYKPIITTNILYILLYVIKYIIIQLIQKRSLFKIYKGLIYSYKLTSVSYFINQNKEFYTKDNYEDIDILSIYKYYLDGDFKHQVETIKL
jgi:thioester reductase-like protein